MEGLFERFDITRIVNCYKFKATKGGAVCLPRKYHAFVYFLSGANDYRYGDKTLHTKKDSFLYLPKGVPYSIERFSESEMIVIDFETVQSDIFAPFSTTVTDNEIRNCFSKSVTLFRRDESYADAAVKSFVYLVIYLLRKNDLSSFYKPASSYLIIKPAVEYIKEHFTEDGITIDALAALCKISTRYFTKMFAFHLKQSAKQFILSLRIELACKLLCLKAYSVSDVALSCGFSNIYYFSRLFKEKTGVSPINYKRSADKT